MKHDSSQAALDARALAIDCEAVIFTRPSDAVAEFDGEAIPQEEAVRVRK